VALGIAFRQVAGDRVVRSIFMGGILTWTVLALPLTFLLFKAMDWVFCIAYGKRPLESGELW
jgi:hypothetical protein